MWIIYSPARFETSYITVLPVLLYGVINIEAPLHRQIYLFIYFKLTDNFDMNQKSKKTKKEREREKEKIKRRILLKHN